MKAKLIFIGKKMKKKIPNPKKMSFSSSTNIQFTITDKRTGVLHTENSWYGKSILGCGLWPRLDGVWADYEQLSWLVFSTFHGQKNFFSIFFFYILASALR